MQRFHLRPSQSPTYANLCRYLPEHGWNATRFNWMAHFSDINFQFDKQAAECLEYKNLLAELVAQYCPWVMPLTFCINDKNWPAVINQIAAQFYIKNSQLMDKIDHLIWILKPATLNNGQHIKIFQDLNQLEQHYLSSNRLGGQHVLQQYITHPHLLNGPSSGHKYTIRMFVVITNDAGTFLYQNGYFNIALQAYQDDDFTLLNSHLTNEHLCDEEKNVVQIPSERYEHFESLYIQIKSIVTATVNALKQQHPSAFNLSKTRKIAIFGFDFIVENNERVWLLECNHGPCFPIDDEHPLQKKLYYNFWQAFIKSFVTPIASKQPLEKINYKPFEEVP